MKKNQIILIIIGVLILVGFVSSFIYWQSRARPESRVRPAAPPELLEPEAPLPETIQSPTASGQVIEISDHTIILSTDEETLSVGIKKDAKIYFLNLERKELRDVEFEDIKVGDKVTISVEKKDETLKGDVVTILSK